MILFLIGLSSIGYQAAWAKYPEKSIAFILPWPPGGGNDVPLRPLNVAAGKILGQQIVMEYHPGGSGAIGMGMLKNRKPDGYTIGMTATASFIAQNLVNFPCKIPDDFTTIMQYSEAPNGLVVRVDSPWKTLKEFLDDAKANPGKIRYSSSGPGHPASIGMELMAKKFQISWTHVPFTGAPKATAAILGGHVDAYASTMLCRPHIVAGKLRLLTVFGEKRLPTFPDVPTASESGHRIVVPNSKILFAPKGLSSEILETLHQAYKKAMDSPEFAKAAAMTEDTVTYKSPQETIKSILAFQEDIKDILQDLKKAQK